MTDDTLSNDVLRGMLRETPAWLVRLTCRRFAQTCAARPGRPSQAATSIARLKLALAMGMPTNDLFWAAARGGDVETLKYVFARYKRKNKKPVGVVEGAAAGGHVRILQWAAARLGLNVGSIACQYAAENGHIDVLEWLWRRTTPSDSRHARLVTAEAAGRAGQLAVLSWIHAQPWACNLIVYAAAGAAGAGRLDTLEWMLTQKDMLADGWSGGSDFVAHSAAAGGHLGCLEWAVARGFRVHAGTAAAAAARGDVAMLECLWGHACPMDTQVYLRAACSGHAHVIEWAKRHKCPMDVFLVVDAWRAATGQRYDLLSACLPREVRGLDVTVNV